MNPEQVADMLRAMRIQIDNLAAATATSEERVNIRVQQIVQELQREPAPAPAQADAIAAVVAPMAGQDRLDRAKAERPEYWSGAYSDPPLKEWKNSLCTYFESTRLYDEQQRVLFAAGLLRGGAKAWWTNRFQEAMEGTRGLPDSTTHLIEELREQFSEESMMRAIRTEWGRLKQAGRPVREYITRFRELMFHVQDSSEGEKIHRFVEGLNERLQVRVDSERPATVNDAFRLAEMWSGAPTPGPMYPTRAHHQKRPGPNKVYNTHFKPRGEPMELGSVHYRPHTGAKRGLDYSKKNPGQPLNKTFRGARMPRNGKSVKVCFKCGKEGHFAASCGRKN